MKFLCALFLFSIASTNAYKIPLISLTPALKHVEVGLGNLVEVAKELGLDILLKSATEVGLAEALATKNPLTLFGPTDEAFKGIPPYVVEHILKDNETALKDVLLYHVLSGKVPSSAIKNDLQVETLLPGKKIRFNIYGNATKVVTAQCAPIDLSKVDQEASNGLLHVLDRVMIPPVGTVVDLVVEIPLFSILKTAVLKAGLQDLLASPGPFTVFAPLDSAFKKIPYKELERILNDPILLKKVLEYHVVKGTYCSAGLTTGTVPTAEGSILNITVEGGAVMVNDAMVDFADAPVSNGVVHVIDTVLIPPTLYEL